MTESALHTEQKSRKTQTLGRQAVSLLLHTVLALAIWIGLMLVGYAAHPAGVSQSAVLLLSMAVPLVVPWIVVRIHPSEMATAVWLIGFIWLMIVGLYVLDLPTGPGRCFQCGAMDKLSRTFLACPSRAG